MTEPLNEPPGECGDVSPWDSQVCLHPKDHRGPHRGRLGTLIWWDEIDRCPAKHRHPQGPPCIFRAAHIGPHSTVLGNSWSDSEPIPDEAFRDSLLGVELRAEVRDRRKAQVRDRLFTDAEFHNAVYAAVNEVCGLLDLNLTTRQRDLMIWSAALALLEA